jgi:hypothetical protein
VTTRYEEDFRSYLRQQTRWTRNLVDVGLRFRHARDVRGGLTAMGLGVGILSLTASLPFVGLPAFSPLALALFHVVASRARYVGFAARATGQSWSVPWLKLGLYAYLDFVAWTRALWQIVVSRSRPTW